MSSKKRLQLHLRRKLLKKFELGAKGNEEDDSDKVFGSTWRRRMRETVGQTIGLFKAEADENTPALEDETSRFLSAAERLDDLEKLYEQVVLGYGGTRRAVCELTRASSGPAARALLECERARKMHSDALQNCLESYVTPLKNQASEVEALVKEYKDRWCKDYFARKRTKENLENKISKAKDSSRYEDDAKLRELKFEHSKKNVKKMAEYLVPLLEAFVEAADDCQSNAIRSFAATDLYLAATISEKLSGWADTVKSSNKIKQDMTAIIEADPVVRLLAGLDDARRRPTPGPPAWPRTKTTSNLTSLLSSRPKLQADIAGNATPFVAPSLPTRLQQQQRKKGAVYGAEIKTLEAPAIIALEGMLAYLESSGGFEREGLFRIPGNSDDVNDIKAELDAGRWTKEQIPNMLAEGDLEDVATLLKMWFRDRADPVLDPQTETKVRAADLAHREDDGLFAKDVNAALEQCSNTPHAYSLTMLLQFLAKVASNHKVNMMTANNLAVCFAPNIFQNDGLSPDDMSDINASIALFKRLIRCAQNHSLTVIGEKGKGTSPPSFEKTSSTTRDLDDEDDDRDSSTSSKGDRHHLDRDEEDDDDDDTDDVPNLPERQVPPPQATRSPPVVPPRSPETKKLPPRSPQMPPRSPETPPRPPPRS